MTKNVCVLLSLVALNAGALQAGDYLLRIQPVAAANGKETPGTIEFQVAEGEPFFVRSTLCEGSQFLARGTLRKIEGVKFELEYFCQVSELRTDPLPRLTREGKARIVLVGKPELVSKLSNAKEDELSTLDFKISIRPLNPVFGTREVHSGFAVRLVDESGKPVANATGGLYGPLFSGGGSNWEAVVVGESNDDGIIRLTEGRASLLWLTFYAEHNRRKLYAAAHLHPDQIRSKDYKYFTIKMTDSFDRWSKPKN